MRVFSWNVQGRVQTTLGRQLERVLAREPDLVALQEVTAVSLPHWQRGLENAGYTVASSAELARSPYPPPPYSTPPFPRARRGHRHDHVQRKYFNLCAARYPLAKLPRLSFAHRQEARYAFPEKYLAVRVNVDGVSIDLHNVHLPPGASRGVIKVHHFEAIRRRVEGDEHLKVLCGDFNAPWSETADGPVPPPSGREWPDDILARWRDAETALFNLRGMTDVYRKTHPEARDFPASHYTGREGALTAHRYDYIFASDELQPDRCVYLSGWLNRDMKRWRPSDHAPVEAELTIPA